MTFIHSVKPFSLEKKTIIVPVVSTANIGQLTADLLIATFSLKRIAVLDSQFCVPVVGARDDAEIGIASPLELYGRQDLDFVVIQQRSPILKDKKESFVEALYLFIKESNFGAALFLSGVDLSNRTDAQMHTPTYQFYPKNGPSLSSTPLQRMVSLSIPNYSTSEPHSKTTTIPFIPGGGLTRRILSSIPSAWNIPTASLLQFVMEGDNRMDAELFATAVAKVIGMDIKEWKQPLSWKEGLFGTPLDQTVYG